MASGEDFFVLHRIIRSISGLAASSFFTEVKVIGDEHVPRKGPIIVVATHHNMMLDPVILSSHFPDGRILNYWSKASLFGNPAVRYVLLSSGNIPVDRKSKDRQVLFKGTFEALSKGYAVALFPEGTSYTEPRIMQVKDGAAWAALEYTRWAKENPSKSHPADVVVIPAAIVYTNKSKYRSSVIMEFGAPITMDPYKEQFFSEAEGAPRLAAKRLTQVIRSRLVEATVNAPNWDTLYAARMARELLWENEGSINLEEFVVISQTLVDLFSTSDPTPHFNTVRRKLLEYYSLLQSTNLSNSVLSALPLPRSLDPNTPATVPSRLKTLVIFVSDSLVTLVHLPFFLFPLIVHMPVYIMGRIGARLVEDEEETQAQNKVAFGLLSMFLIYPATFFFLWALFWYTPVGAVVAALTMYTVAIYHNRMINANYERAKRFIAAWRILIGVWAPKKWDLSLAALSQYTTPSIPSPAENPWIDKPKTPVQESSPEISSALKAQSPTKDIPNILPSTPAIALPNQREPPVKARPKRRPSTRRIMRHVLRARVEALRALAGFFDELERTADGKKLQVRASNHLARIYGGVDAVSSTNGEFKGTDGLEEPQGWRYATEVIGFLKKRGAKIPSLKNGPIKEDWALSSDAEWEPATPTDEKDDLVWVTGS